MLRTQLSKSLYLLLLAAVVFAPCLAHAAPRKTALFETRIGSSRFTIAISNPAAIREARLLLRRRQSAVIVGEVSVGRMNYNKAWGFHLNPGSVSFADVAIDTCDASPRLVEKSLSAGAALLPGNVWCPWNSSLIREVKARRSN